MLFVQFDLFIMTAHYLNKLINLIRSDEQQLPEFKKCGLIEFVDVATKNENIKFMLVLSFHWDSLNLDWILTHLGMMLMIKNQLRYGTLSNQISNQGIKYPRYYEMHLTFFICPAPTGQL